MVVPSLGLITFLSLEPMKKNRDWSDYLLQIMRKAYSQMNESTSQNSYISEASKENTTTRTTDCLDCKWLQIWPYFQANIILPQFHDIISRHTPRSDTISHSNTSIFTGTYSSSSRYHRRVQRGPGDAYKSSMLPYKRETLSLGNPNLLQLAINLPAICF